MLEKIFSKLVLVTVLAVPILAYTEAANAQNTHGATAYSATSDATGISWDHATEKEALNAAVAAWVYPKIGSVKTVTKINLGKSFSSILS